MPVCPVCNNEEFRKRRLLPEVAVLTCGRCGFLISEFSPSVRGKSQSVMINMEQYELSIGRTRREQAAQIAGIVRQHAAAGSDWLDIGSGFGYMLKEALAAGFHAVGIEPDEKPYRYACELVGSAAVRHGLMQDDSVPDGSLDIVSMLDVLEHIPADGLAGFARMIHRKLRPNGWWVIKVPSTDGLFFKVSHAMASVSGALMSGPIRRLWLSEHEFPHTVYFNQATLKRFLAKCGFECPEVQYLSEIPSGSVLARIRADTTIPVWQAFASVPVFYLIKFIESIRGKSDAILVLARRLPPV